MFRRGSSTWRFALTLLAIGVVLPSPRAHTQAQAPTPLPAFEVDPWWPKPLPNNWILGAVAGVAVDARDHVWITHRPSTLQPNETRSIWRAAPPVLEFDADGALVSSWGGPGTGYEWPQLEHGIYVDDRDRVWLGSGGDKDAQILAFTRDGKFQMQIGHQGKGRGSNDTENLGAPANMVVDRDANELYVADGYVNHRVIVFDADTGRYKRHWGAYGRRPDDGFFERTGERLPGPFSGAVQNENKPSQYDPNAPPAPQFRIVHAVRISRDGLVYVCDRTNNRIQVFRKDGTFVQEVVIAKETFGSGSVWDIGFTVDPEQKFLIVPDGTNQRVYIVERRSLRVVGEFGRAGHWAGQFYGAHNLAVNSKGDLFITETYEGKRVQKFRYSGMRPVPAGGNPVPSSPSAQGAPIDRGPGGIYRFGDAGIVMPQKLREARADYTPEAMKAKIQGSVVLEAIVNPDGTIGEVHIVKSLDPVHGLDNAAVEAARQWRFVPGSRLGVRVPVLLTMEISFNLR